MNKNSIFLSIILVAFTLLPVSCVKYDDSDLYSKYNDLNNRVSKLETICKAINSDIESLRTIVTALEQNDGIVSIDEVIEEGSVVGYRINLKSGSFFTIYNGKPGSPGRDADPLPQIGRVSSRCSSRQQTKVPLR